uniref:Uncharacterized protein n=1 Tax=Anopheles quadriannulatus TaxID=34691 RepID=A0A182XSS2_ANOQN
MSSSSCACSCSEFAAIVGGYFCVYKNGSTFIPQLHNGCLTTVYSTVSTCLLCIIFFFFAFDSSLYAALCYFFFSFFTEPSGTIFL